MVKGIDGVSEVDEDGVEDDVENVIQELDKLDSLDEASEELQEKIYDLMGIDAPGDTSSPGDALKGIETEPENLAESIRDVIVGPSGPEGPTPDRVDIDIESDDEQTQLLAEVKALLQDLNKLNQQLVLLDEERNALITDQTTSTGSDSAATIHLGTFRNDFEIFYDVENSSDDLFVEVSLDGDTWHHFAQLSIAVGGGADVAQGSTVFTHVRAYPGEGFSDTDINVVKAVSKGT